MNDAASTRRARHAEYIKWLRFYFDFCDKYPVPEELSERVRLFPDKLRAKKQNEEHLKGAAHAVLLYFELQRAERQSQVPVGVNGEARVYSTKPNSAQIQPTKQAEGKTGYAVTKPANSAAVPAAKQSTPPPGRIAANRSYFIVEGYAVTTNSPEWDAILAAMAGDQICRPSHSPTTICSSKTKFFSVALPSDCDYTKPTRNPRV